MSNPGSILASAEEDAILLHGGEAERSRRLFSRPARAERPRLLRFVSTR
ncbi:MAG: di-heme oxidoredictase family protein [Longimicrobiales bacterium]